MHILRSAQPSLKLTLISHIACLSSLLAESDQSSTSKGAGTIEMYAPASGSGGSYNNGVIETSLSGTSDEENKSDRASSPYSGHTDYLMVSIPSVI